MASENGKLIVNRRDEKMNAVFEADGFDYWNVLFMRSEGNYVMLGSEIESRTQAAHVRCDHIPPHTQSFQGLDKSLDERHTPTRGGNKNVSFAHGLCS